jgi:hypothetical protein
MASIDVRLQFRRLSKVIAAMAEVAGGTGHASTTGRIREKVVNSFLKPDLPKTFAIRSGIIIDSTGQSSKQQDCVIVDTRLPLIDVGDEHDAILIAESVVATIEVKSFLSAAELDNALQSIASTKSLKRNGHQVYEKGGVQIQVQEPHPILCYIFGYDGAELNTLAGVITEFAEKRNNGGLVPEAVCLLQKGVLERSQLMPIVKGSNVMLPAIAKTTLTMKPLAKDSLFRFYGRLIDDIMPLRIINYDIDAYYAEGDLE